MKWQHVAKELVCDFPLKSKMKSWCHYMQICFPSIHQAWQKWTRLSLCKFCSCLCKPTFALILLYFEIGRLLLHVMIHCIGNSMVVEMQWKQYFSHLASPTCYWLPCNKSHSDKQSFRWHDHIWGHVPHLFKAIWIKLLKLWKTCNIKLIQAHCCRNIDDIWLSVTEREVQPQTCWNLPVVLREVLTDRELRKGSSLAKPKMILCNFARSSPSQILIWHSPPHTALSYTYLQKLCSANVNQM